MRACTVTLLVLPFVFDEVLVVLLVVPVVALVAVVAAVVATPLLAVLETFAACTAITPKMLLENSTLPAAQAWSQRRIRFGLRVDCVIAMMLRSWHAGRVPA